MTLVFDSKQAARQYVWDRLEHEGLSRFPFPPHGRIPNFKGAEIAARKLFEIEPWSSAKRMKVNPDSPQAPVRFEALMRGITVYVPTPRLEGGFYELDPAGIEPANFDEASKLSTMHRWARPVPLTSLRRVDAIVTGSACVTIRGKRCGKGAGFSDLEFALLRELGHDPVPVATTVHDVQIVEDLPVESNDLPLSAIVTPSRHIGVEDPLPAPDRIQWDRLSDADLRAMPILLELKQILEAVS